MAWTSVASLSSPTAGAFTFTGLSLSGVKILQIRLSRIRVTNDGTDVRLTMYVAGVEIVATYEWSGRPVSTSAAFNADSGTSAASVVMMSNDSNWDVGNAAAESCGGRITIANPGSTALHKRVQAQLVHIGPTGNAIRSAWAGLMANAGAIDGVKIGGTSNLVSGHVRLWSLS